jgi:hypothetical protein
MELAVVATDRFSEFTVVDFVVVDEEGEPADAATPRRVATNTTPIPIEEKTTTRLRTVVCNGAPICL